MSAAELDARLKEADAPFVVRGLIADWPLVKAGRRARGRSRLSARAPPRPRLHRQHRRAGAGDRLFYDEAMGMNFRTGRAGLADIFAGIDANEGKPRRARHLSLVGRRAGLFRRAARGEPCRPRRAQADREHLDRHPDADRGAQRLSRQSRLLRGRATPLHAVPARPVRQSLSRARSTTRRRGGRSAWSICASRISTRTRVSARR